MRSFGGGEEKTEKGAAEMADSSLRYRPDAPEWADMDERRPMTRGGHGAAEVEATTGTMTGPEEQP